MSFFSRFFAKPRRPERPTPLPPNDDQITSMIQEAKWLNTRAVTNLVEASSKQERDAGTARRLINEVLQRADLRAPNHAGNKK